MSIENDAPTTYQAPQYGQYGQQQQPGPPYGLPQGRKRKRKWVLPASLAVAGLLIGGGVGGVIGYGEKPEPVTIEKVVEKEVEVPVTPTACITAIEDSAAMIDRLLGLADISSAAISAVAEDDIPALDRQTQKVKDLNADIEDMAGPLAVAVENCKDGTV